MADNRDKSFHVIVSFGRGITASVQGEVMLAMEKDLRSRGLPAEVFKDTMGDDSLLRNKMTKEQRARL